MQSVIDPLDVRVVERPPRRDDGNLLSRRRCAAHETKSMPFESFVQIKMGQKQMLVQKAAHQPLLERIAVQEALPCGDFGFLARR